MRIRIDTVQDLKSFIKQSNVSNEAAIKAIEVAFTVWVLSDFSKDQLLEEIDVLTTKYNAIERPIFLFN